LARLQNKITVITGAASGIGRAIAVRFAAEGAALVIGDRNEQRLSELATVIGSSGASVISSVGDISTQGTAEALVDLAIGNHGRIDVLVNNAGIMDLFQGAGELSDDLWRAVLATNLEGPMFTMRTAIGHMIQRAEGSIVNIASLSGMSGASGAAYTASKHALVGLTLNTAWRYMKEGIRCNAVCPGVVNTNILESITQSEIDTSGMARTLEFFNLSSGALEPSEIASAALFLASDEARYVNGAILSVDGGLCAT
jgi:NAD(P)-dependent dehydrogenase (short-subunit alcohol dehydrogenase family)